MRKLRALVGIGVFTAFIVFGICVIESPANEAFCGNTESEKTGITAVPFEDEEIAEETVEGREMWVFEGGKTYYNDDCKELVLDRHEVQGTSAKEEETVEKTEETETFPEVETRIVYSVCGTEVPCADYLYERLDAEGIGWWMPYAMATIYQESRCDVNATSPDGLDRGLLQYRSVYWEANCEDTGVGFRAISDSYAQIDVYVAQTARRLKNYGYDTLSAISAHKRSDWGSYDAKYVAEVTQWLGYVEIREEVLEDESNGEDAGEGAGVCRD